MDVLREGGVLFVGHDATQTGAPMVLLHLLRWHKEKSDRPLAVLLGSGGELVGEYERVAPTMIADRGRWRNDSLRTQLARWAGCENWARATEAREIRRSAGGPAPAAVYVNSIASAKLIGLLPSETPVITHVHELDFMFQRLAGEALQELLRRTHKFIACSAAVQESLVKRQGIALGRIETVHEFIPEKQIQAQRKREEVLQELRLPNDAHIVIGVGMLSWNKGTDLFLQLGKQVCARRERAYFVWVGGGGYFAEYEFDRQAMELAEKVRFTGARLNPADYVGASDIFVLTSREDPYPLATLEAAALGKPIVCFADAGGMPEFVEEDCGYVVPFMNMEAMAERVVSLIDSEEQRHKMGEAANRKVRERHDVSVAGPQIAEIIERTIAEH